MSPKTEADLKDCHMVQTMHLNGGSEWFGYVYRCVEHPRLSRHDKYMRKDRSVASVWWADGVPCETLETALDAIQQPPVLTDEERAALELVPAEWADIRDQLEYRVGRSLADKGLVEWEHGKCRRRADG
jgi:hypothetical protein